MIHKDTVMNYTFDFLHGIVIFVVVTAAAPPGVCLFSPVSGVSPSKLFELPVLTVNTTQLRSVYMLCD